MDEMTAELAELEKRIKQKARKTAKKIILIVTPIFFTLISTVMIPILVVAAIGQMLNVEDYEQECPELVRVFIQDNYEEFEKKVRSLCDDPAFMNFVANSEFDNAYTKMVYGGTNAYTQEELKGNYVGVGDQKASWVTKDGKKYKAKSVLETIQDYIDKGVSEKKININDNYLAGYENSSGVEYGKIDNEDKDSKIAAKSMTFDKWINNSYYNIPYFYHWAMAKESSYKQPSTVLGYVYDGSEVGLPNWRQDEKGNWSFMNYANTMGKPFSGLPDISYQVFSDSDLTKKNYKKMTYTDYLNTGWTAYRPKKGKTGYLLQSQVKDCNDGKTAAYAEGAMLGYKMAVNKIWLSKVIKKLSGGDQNYDYYPFSKYYERTGKSTFSSVVDNLYVYDWYDIKSGNQSNYMKYLAKPKNIDTIGKREGSVNKNVSEWQDKFAEYFAKEIYYVYPNRDYVVDYFLSNTRKEKKVAFLQRSFYAMATGASLDLDIDEEYKITNGKIGSVVTENVVGSNGIKTYTISDLSVAGIRYIDYNTEEDEAEEVKDKNVSDGKTIESKYNEWISKQEHLKDEKENFFEASYKLTLQLELEDGTKKTIDNIPVTVHLNYISGYSEGKIECSVKINSDDEFVKQLPKKYIMQLQSAIKIKWVESYYKKQAADNKDDKVEKDLSNEKNPLDLCKFKIKNTWQATFDEKTVNLSAFDSSIFYAKTLKNGFIEAAKKGNSKENIFSTIVDGTLKGTRELNFRYSDHSFLNYKVTELKDDSGKLTSINITIYTYYPDVSQYTEGKYRVAYAFETEGALQESLKLLDYVLDNKTLNGVTKEVDLSQIIISDDKQYIKDDILIEDSDLITFLVEYIAQLEHGYSGPAYSSVRNAAGCAEGSITVGMFQWYDGRAHNALRFVFNKNKKWCKSNLSSGTYANLSDKNWGPNSLSDAEIRELSNMMDQDWARQAQVELAKKDVKNYIDLAKKIGLTNPKLVAYFSQAYHNTPTRAKNMAADIIKQFGADKINNEKADDALLAMREWYKKNTSYYTVDGLAWRYDKAYEVAKDLQLTANVYTPVSTAMAKKAVDAAVSKSGCKYSQAQRNGRTIFDCSSLAAYAWKEAGVDITGGAGVLGAQSDKELQWCESHADKVCEGKADLSKLQTGDLLFFTGNSSHYKGIGHVAIYYGDNKVVEAGSPVGIYNLGNRSSFHSAWRIRTSQTDKKSKADKGKKKQSKKK